MNLLFISGSSRKIVFFDIYGFVRIFVKLFRKYYMNIVKNIIELRSQIPQHVKVVAISKTKTVAEIREAMSVGQIFFGESKVQELIAKQKQIPESKWHFIGHLQTNKVKQIVPFVHMIQSVDSFRLLEEINNHACKINRVIDCLLQIHIAREETKYGLSEQETIEMLKNNKLQSLNNVRICGLMGIATFTDDIDVIRNEFRGLSSFFQRLRNEFFIDIPSFSELSMGMSDDYIIAIEEGATIVRIGSSIFGKR